MRNVTATPKKNSWFKTVLYGAYQLFMVILCICNSIFLIYHIYDLKFTPTDTNTILLAVVGFFFAFAGINIYSIFNTNVDAEKERLNDIYLQYKKEIEMTTRDLEYAKKIIRYYQQSQLLTNSTTYNSQSIEYIFSLQIIIKEYKSFLLQLSENGLHHEFTDSKGEFIDVSRGILADIRNFKELKCNNVQSHFFRNVLPVDKASFIQRIDKLINELQDLESYDFEHQQSSNVHPITCKTKFKNLWLAIKDLFNRN